MKLSNNAIKWFVAIFIIGSVIGLGSYLNNRSEKLDAFAQCLKDRNAVFYGAFWCSHCQNQKKLFDRSERLLPYVECSTPDGKRQKQVCNEKKIEGYPTWEFADGSRLGGEVSLQTLSEKTGCPLPATE